MSVNLIGSTITEESGKNLALDVLEFMRTKLADYQEETGQLFNLEATPAESCAYRLAKKDREEFGSSIYTQGVGTEEPYYTNSCHMPVKDVESIKQLFDHQDDLQVMFTGGTVVHVYLEGPISGRQAQKIVKSICETYKVPYVSLSPLNTICPARS